MEATFHSYLTEAVYTMEREKCQRPESAVASGDQDQPPAALSAMRKLSAETSTGINHGLLSYIDADSAPVKMRERPRRGLPRPSGYDIVNNSFLKENRTSADESPKVSPASVASNSPGLFQRNMKFFLSFNKKQRRRSSGANSNFSAPYLRRSQS